MWAKSQRKSFFDQLKPCFLPLLFGKTDFSIQNEQLITVRNYELVIQNLSSFYRQVLNQIITKTLPNGLIIVRAGRSNAGLHELNSLLNLLINAAVSSETKEVYINYIKSFDHAYQAEIAERITATQVTFFFFRTDDYALECVS